MTQAGLLLLLWDALQQRQTTFGQVLDLSAACGLDGRRVLADHFASAQSHRHERTLIRNRVITGGECAGPVEAPAQSFTGVGVRGGVVELFEKRFPSAAVYPHENLRGTAPRQASHHTDHRPIAEGFFMLCIRQKVVGPVPILTATLKAGHRLILDMVNLQWARVYAYRHPLSKLSHARYSCIVSGGAA
ncbi:hypothetical protein JET76_23950 [Pseudomonas putida]|uniref:hypothetical protein n=1 Tax=Pseudomonas putida group TaxID=136845 RepID=UPI0006724FCB|nr:MULTISPECIES: hypothetical protein [Pseudomonas putida group]MBI6944379.1 hypothetical protein [Pseudomonas putida]MBI6960691.1 hypothetical protein [Pseudomonas putida]MCL8299590.1 hypothetical protein [Pseudomonas mosselii]MCL8339973.1 hypothetical protein [Pseudomonas mosselii]WJR31536.1 hypothetical protein LU678_008440 [Pseudomonas mosselii]